MPFSQHCQPASQPALPASTASYAGHEQQRPPTLAASFFKPASASMAAGGKDVMYDLTSAEVSHMPSWAISSCVSLWDTLK